MSTDYIVASLPALAFDQPAPLTAEKFREMTQGDVTLPEKWRDLEAQIRNAMARARGGEKDVRPAEGCSVYWAQRVQAVFQEKDVAKRAEAMDRVWWDAAGELTPVASPLSAGALATYAIRLALVLKRGKANADVGREVFERNL